jgi:predicted DsbA family dithiol-disulfide isomerase
VALFGLANAGIHVTGGLISDAVTSPITLGILFGYVVGKPLGILVASWIATRPALHGPRSPLSWPSLAGGGAVAGIGFTVSLLISALAFHGQRLSEAKLGVLASAVVAPLVAWAVFAVMKRLPTEDFECPYCGQAEAVVRELLNSSDDDVRYVWRHLPLNDVHTSAQLAAEASEAAAAQGKFWEHYDALFAHQGTFSPQDLVNYATQIGLDLDRFRDDLHHHAETPRVAEDVASADSSGVSGTPTFFVNGRRHQGAYDIDTLTSVVRAARRRASLTTV